MQTYAYACIHARYSPMHVCICAFYARMYLCMYVGNVNFSPNEITRDFTSFDAFFLRLRYHFLIFSLEKSISNIFYVEDSTGT